MLNRKTNPISEESARIYNIMIPHRSDLRQIKEYVDFSFIYDEVKDYYDPYIGRPSEDPVRLIKAELLKIKYNLAGDDELLAEISDRASFRDFLDIDLEEELWDRTTLVKFRQKVGSQVIDKLLANVIKLCAEHNMIGGKHEVIDGTNTKARARIVGNRDNIYIEEPGNDSKKKLENPTTDEYKINVDQQDSFINLERTSYPKDDTAREENRKKKMIPVGDRVSKGDPDARFYKMKNGEKSKLGYQNAFATDIKEGIITRVLTIPGCDNMADQVKPLIGDKVVPELTLDGEFSTGELVSLAQDKGVVYNVPKRVVGERGVYPKSVFQYDYDLDAYRCPQNNVLNRSSQSGESIIYRGSAKACHNCPVLNECTKSKTKVRVISRDQYEQAWEVHDEYIQSDQYQFAKVIRGILAEGKFFEANILYDLKNARYVGLKLMHAQAQMTAVVINLKRFLKVIKSRKDKENPIPEKSRAPFAA
jgi:transposase